MPYISSIEVSKKRKDIKKAFPNWKFSITKKHDSTLSVAILEADIKLTNKANESVNHYYLEEHYKDDKEIYESLKKLADIMLEGEKIVSEDSDYGSIPNFYVNLSIGQWDKPFVYKGK